MIRTLLFGAMLLAPLAAHAARVACIPGVDNAPAINAALALADTQLGPGECSIASAVLLRGPYHLSGAGQGVTVLQALTGGAFNVLEIGIHDGRAPVTGWAVSGLTVDGAADKVDPTTNHSDGIAVWSDAFDGTISDVGVYNAGDSGISVFGPRVTVTGCTVAWNWKNGIMVHADGFHLSGSLVSNNSLAVTPDYRTIAASGVKSFDQVDLEPGSSNADVKGNTVFGGDFLLRAAAGTPMGGDVIEGNTSVGSRVSGVIVSGPVTGFAITANHFWNDVQFSITIGGGGPSNGTIAGNDMHGGGKIAVHKLATGIVQSANTAD